MVPSANPLAIMWFFQSSTPSAGLVRNDNLAVCEIARSASLSCADSWDICLRRMSNEESCSSVGLGGMVAAAGFEPATKGL